MTKMNSCRGALRDRTSSDLCQPPPCGCRTALTLGTLAGYVDLATGLAAVMMRVKLDETALCKHFGAAYRTYQQQTKRIIPFSGDAWRRKRQPSPLRQL